MTSRQIKVKSYFSIPELYLKKSFDVRLRSIIAADMAGSVKGLRILDIGCGDGSVSAQFLASGAEVTFADISENMLSLAYTRTDSRLRHKAKYLNVSLEELLETEKYDLVIAFGLMAHVDSVPEAIGKISRLVKDGGRLMVQISDYSRPLTRLLYLYGVLTEKILGHTSYEKNKTSVQDIISISVHKGFKPLSIKRYGIVLPILKSVFSDETLFVFHLLTLKKSFLSRIASDAILEFRKGFVTK